LEALGNPAVSLREATRHPRKAALVELAAGTHLQPVLV